MPPGHKKQEIKGRGLVLCERMAAKTPAELIYECPCCDKSTLLCCPCDGNGEFCHHFRVVSVDGSCLHNGQAQATAGIGVVLGTDDGDIHSIPITERMDPLRKRTNQRAELLAAIKGLKLIRSEYLRTPTPTPCEGKFVVASDSKYVVHGMTEWYSKWARNGFLNAAGNEPANLDLYRRLHNLASGLESRYNVQIGFWYIPRAYNLADEPSKDAARDGEQAAV